MQQISAIIEMTVKKIKEPAFLILFLLALLLGYFMSGTDTFSIQNDDATLSAILSGDKSTPLLAGFAMILFMTLLIGIFAGATDIPREIEARMVMLILAKPVSRGHYLLGKYIGIIIISMLFFTLAGFFSYIFYFVKTGDLYQFNILCRQFFMFIIIFPFVAMAMMVSTFLNDIASMIVVAVYIVFSVFISIIAILIDLLPKSLGIASYIHGVAYAFPNLFYFLQKYQALSLTSLLIIVYSLSISVVFLTIATLRLNSRDLI